MPSTSPQLSASLRRMGRLIWSVGALVVLLTSGCVIEREFEEPDTKQVEPPPVVPPYARPVRVVATFPPDQATNVPLDTPLWLELDQYVDPDEFSLSRTIRLTSNGVSANLRVQWEMASKRIVGRLDRPLLEHFEYRMELDSDTILAVSGAPMLERHRANFTTGDQLSEHGGESQIPTWSDVKPIFQEACGCHTLEPMPTRWFSIPPLTFEGMVGAPSIQRPELDLVEPFRPHASYLMHKVLADYPDRDGTAMPPRWAGDVELETEVSFRALTWDEILLIEDWIQLGAEL